MEIPRLSLFQTLLLSPRLRPTWGNIGLDAAEGQFA